MRLRLYDIAGGSRSERSFRLQLDIRVLDDSMVGNLTLVLKMLSKSLSTSNSDFFAAPSRRPLSMTWLKEIDLCHQHNIRRSAQVFTVNYETEHIVF